jgi:hypothetical protein
MPPLGFLLLVLLIAECFFAIAIIRGNLPTEAMRWCLLGGGFIVPVVVIFAGTILILRGKRPSLFGDKAWRARRREVLTNIEPACVVTVFSDFVSEGADVASVQQRDGKYTLEALFGSDLRS